MSITYEFIFFKNNRLKKVGRSFLAHLRAFRGIFIQKYSNFALFYSFFRKKIGRSQVNFSKILKPALQACLRLKDKKHRPTFFDKNLDFLSISWYYNFENSINTVVTTLPMRYWNVVDSEFSSSVVSSEPVTTLPMRYWNKII